MKAFAKPRAMALDAYASTSDCNCVLLIISILEHVFGTLLINGWCSLWFPGASSHACKHSGGNIFAKEGDFVKFEAIMAPLCDVNSLVTCGSVPHSTNVIDNTDLLGRWQSNLVLVSKLRIAFSI